MQDRLAPLVRYRSLFPEERPAFVHRHFAEFRVVHHHVTDRSGVVGDPPDPVPDGLVIMRGALWALFFGGLQTPSVVRPPGLIPRSPAKGYVSERGECLLFLQTSVRRPDTSVGNVPATDHGECNDDPGTADRSTLAPSETLSPLRLKSITLLLPVSTGKDGFAWGQAIFAELVETPPSRRLTRIKPLSERRKAVLEAFGEVDRLSIGADLVVKPGGE